MTLALGIDLGTSGLRGCLLDADGRCHAQAALPATDPQRWLTEPQAWWQGLVRLMRELGTQAPLCEVSRLAIDGTSSTLLWCDRDANPYGPTLPYHDTRAHAEARRVATCAMANGAVQGPSSGLAKLLWLLAHYPPPPGAYLASQADWLLCRLGAPVGLSDPNNMLKCGLDAATLAWPPWLDALGAGHHHLPQVRPAGSRVGVIDARVAATLGLPSTVTLHLGTTDSTAAFLATGLSEPEDALTSLGSTLVLKVVSDHPVEAPAYGVYSQPLGRHWLVGGASNSGGAVLSHYFDGEQLATLSARIDPERPSGLHYYPLLAPGERFPRADPSWRPQLTPRPEDDAQFLQGLLEGLCAIEAEGYDLLTRLGAPAPRRLATVGGGAQNPVWRRLRERRLQLPLVEPVHAQAACGSARLAWMGHAPTDGTHRSAH